MTQKEKTHSFDFLFTFLLLLAFLLFSLLLAGTGSVIYRHSSDSLNENYTSRTALSYITEKVRQHDSRDAVRLLEIGGVPALSLEETLDGESFLTYIYYYDGYLRELFIRKNSEPSPEMGSPIVELSSCSFESVTQEDADRGAVFTVRVSDKKGDERSILLHTSS